MSKWIEINDNDEFYLISSEHVTNINYCPKSERLYINTDDEEEYTVDPVSKESYEKFKEKITFEDGLVSLVNIDQKNKKTPLQKLQKALKKSEKTKSKLAMEVQILTRELEHKTNILKNMAAQGMSVPEDVLGGMSVETKEGLNGGLSE